MLPAPMWYTWTCLVIWPLLCLTAQFSCSAVSHLEACLPTWCECASQITTLPLPATVTPSLAGAGITLLTTAVSSSTFQYSLACDGSCNFATIPSQAICVDNKNLVPNCPTPANILVREACAAASGQDVVHATKCSNAPFAGSNETTTASSRSLLGVDGIMALNSSVSAVTSSSSLSVVASTRAVTLASSTSTVSSIITSANVSSTPHVNPNPYDCSQRKPGDPDFPASMTTMFCVCQGTTLPLQSTVASSFRCAYTSSPFPANQSVQVKTSSQTPSPIVAATVSSSVISLSVSSPGPYVTSTGLPPGNYSLAKCSNPILSNPDSPDDMTKCLYANCQEVKAHAIAYWKDYHKAGNPGSFLDQFAYYMGPTDGMHCDAEYPLLDCTDTMDCPSYNWPAGWMLMGEVIQFTQFYRMIHDGFAYNYAPTLGLCYEFGKTLAHVDDTSTLWQKILIAIAGLFGGQILASILRKILIKIIAQFAAENAEYITQIKLFISNVSSGGAIMGVNLDVPATQPDITGDLEAGLTVFFKTVRAAIEIYIGDMFNGSNTTQFEKTFGTGVWAWPAILSAVNDTNFDTEISTLYFGILAVPAWTLRQLNPVLMYDDKDSDCSAPDPFRDHGDSYDGQLHYTFDNDDSITHAYVCYDNKKFWLAGWSSGYKMTYVQVESAPPSGWGYSRKFLGLPGIETLNGTVWGTLSLLDLVTSAWEGYKSNNNTNDYSSAPLFSGSLPSSNLALAFGSGILTPGLVQITLCPLSSLFRKDTLLLGTVPNVTGFASSPCPSPAYWNCPKFPCDGYNPEF